jgi:hypothetical protein
MDAMFTVVATTHEALVHRKRSPKHQAAMVSNLWHVAASTVALTK